MTRTERRLYFLGGALVGLVVDPLLFWLHFLRAPRRAP